MNSFISINSITLRKLLNRCKLTLRGDQEIIREANKGFVNWSGLNGLARKIDFKELFTNINKKL